MWFFFDLSPSPSLSLSLCLPLVPLLLPPSLTNRLRRDVAQTKRDNSVRVLSFPVFSFFFLPLPFSSLSITLAPFYLPSARDIAQPYRGDGVVPGAPCFQSRSVSETDTYIYASFHEGIADYEASKTIVDYAR